MARKLGTTVHVHGHGVFGPGDTLPDEVRELLKDNPRVWAEDATDDESVCPGPSETVAPNYEALKVGDLRAEIDRRNASRGAGDDQIKPAGDKKVDLVAALTADDARE